ncbi:MAG: sodium-dependent transporter [Acidobacteriota bacterium]|nr:MAG: sodium-dependent transporter [Acidobacteriota bacterium]
MQQKVWSSHFVFLLVAIGTAVGLGNMWKFPYVAGVSGGGAFVLVYILSLVVFILPVLIAELMIGRMGRSSSMGSVANVAAQEGHSRAWGIVGLVCALASYLIMTFYTIVAGWSIGYLIRMVRGDLDGATAALSTSVFDALLASPAELALWHGVFTVATVAIAIRGLEKGVERAFKLMMPALFGLLLVLVVYGLTRPSAGEALRFLFTPDLSKIDASVVLAAVGQAFFSIGVATGIMITFGAYLPDNISIPRAALTTVAADTFVALISGIAIFPIVFQYGLDPAEGPGLVFMTLPVAFAKLPAGTYVGIAFFVLFIIAALTSLIGTMEAILVLVEESLGWSRKKAGFIAGGLAWLLGLTNVLSLNVLSDFRPIAGKTLFEMLDFLTANLMLPLGGILVAVFAGWFVSAKTSEKELRFKSPLLYRAWLVSLRYLAPIAIFLVLLANLRA